MTEHTLLSIIAVAVVINAVAWIVVVLIGLRIHRELNERVSAEVREVKAEVLPLLRETRSAVTEVRRTVESGRRITEEIATAVVLRRISPQWFSKKSTYKVGLGAAREGLGLLRSWLQRQNQELDSVANVELEVEDSPSS